VRLRLIRPNLGDYRSSDAMPPLAMAILAARAPAFSIELVDEKVEPVTIDDAPDLVALSIETYTARRGYQIADGYRARGVPVVMGGYHPTFMPDEALEHADAIVVGDAEGAWERLLADFRARRLARRYQGDNARPLADYRLDRSIFDGKRYAPLEVVQYGRGCRFACDFCSIHSFYGANLRVRPLDGLVAEIAGLPARRLLFFVDDNLFGRKADFFGLLDAIAPLGRRWSCQITIDVARDEALLDRLAASGCRCVMIGFESMSSENLRQMGKRWNNRVSGSYRNVVDALHARGIGVYGMFVFGYDADTVDSFAPALEFALEARLEIANFNPLNPTPGSALYARLHREQRLLRPTWWLDPDYRYGEATFAPRGMTADELTEGVFELRRRFFSWRSIGTRVLDARVPFSGFHRGLTVAANLISRREILNKQFRPLGIRGGVWGQ
jgi:radical SAM superfamily enzyme YgiQ (UPF0313 family)